MQIEILTKRGRLIESVMPFMAKDLMTAQQADDFGFCEKCNLDTFCHPLVRSAKSKPGSRYGATYDKLCTMVYFDICNPDFKLKDLI